MKNVVDVDVNVCIFSFFGLDIFASNSCTLLQDQTGLTILGKRPGRPGPVLDLLSYFIVLCFAYLGAWSQATRLTTK